MSSIYSAEEDSFLLSRAIEDEISKLKNKEILFLEIGVGSGIQLQTAFQNGIKKQNIFGVDLNPDAVKLCKSLGFNCKKSDLFSTVKGKYDLIVFNPPYLPEDGDEPLDSRIATTGGKNGSEIINKFLVQSKKHLNKNGFILLLTSSLTKGIKWNNFKKKKVSSRKIFFEELVVWKLYN